MTRHTSLWALATLLAAAGCTVDVPDTDAPAGNTGGAVTGGDTGGAVTGGDTGGAVTGGSTGASGGCVEDGDCDDGDPCTLGDHCTVQKTCAPGEAPSCDDGVPCTDDACFAAEGAPDGWACTHPIQAGHCLIDEACYAAGDTHPTDECSACSPWSSQLAWAWATDGLPCDAGGGVCVAGECVGIPAILPEDMVFVPAGVFAMGCDEGCTDYDEGPLHEVHLDAFAIERTEVTVAAWAECFDAGVCAPPSSAEGYAATWDTPGLEQHPVNYIDHGMAKTYCGWRGRRLCTEAEWEKAARGTDGRRYPWGEDEPTCDLAVRYTGPPEYAHGCGEKQTWAVGSMPDGASPWGALDMAGNVWEFVADWYDPYYYEESPAANPAGPLTGTDRVVRGGGFEAVPSDLRTMNRWSRNSGDADLGVRCCASPP